MHGVATTEEVFAGIRELVVARRPRFQTETTQALHKSSTTRLAHHRRDKPVAVETSRTRWKVRHIPLEPACFLCARFLRRPSVARASTRTLRYYDVDGPGNSIGPDQTRSDAKVSGLRTRGSFRVALPDEPDLSEMQCGVLG